MTADPGRPPNPQGRRHNGLIAQSFASVGDVDPRVGEHLLDVLYLNGIAAYLQPTVDYDSVTRAASLPRQPTDRLWVDRGRVEEARGVVAAEAAAAGRSGTAPPSQSAVDEDKAWAEIVAFFDKQPTSPVPPWPVNEDADQPWGRRRDDVKAADGGRPAITDAAEAEPDEPPVDAADEEEGYVPPPPPPLPRISKGTAGAIVAVGFGLLMLLAPGVLDLDPDVGLTIGILSVVAGVGYLIWHMHDGPPIDDRPDDGAVV